jgi:hypothetical protein
MSALRGTRGRIVAGVFGVFAAGLLVVVACGDRVDSGTGPLVLYPGERNGDDADLNGILVRVGDCLYVEEGGTRFLLAFPSHETSWREKDQGVRLGGWALRFGGWAGVHFGGETLRVGEWVDLGGSGRSRADPPWQVAWVVPPDSSCDTTNVWVAG